MNILQILPELNVGGVETGTVDLARHLVRQGHKAVVVSEGGSLVAELEAAGAIHYILPVGHKSFLSIFKMAKAIEEVIVKEKIDIVHARSRVPALSAFFAARRAGAVFVTTCHGYYSRHFFSRVMGWGKLVIAISNCVARHMIDDFGVAHERIRLIPRGVDILKFKYSSPKDKRKEDFNVGIIGRITPLKGHLYFIKAMALLARQVPRLKIWIVGDAPASKQGYKEQVEVLVRRLGLSHCTQFLGAQKDIPSILSGLDLLVLATTTHEAFGRVIVEAQASGVPVVATEVGGVVDIIENGKNGLLVPAQDPKGMADVALKIYKDPSFALRLAEEGYKKVKEKFTVEKMVERTLEVYREALTKRNILVLKIGSLGDVILISASLKAIKAKFGPDYKVTMLVGEESRDILLRCPYIDELLVVNLKNKDKGLRGLFKVGAMLRKRYFDFSIDFQNSRKSHILSFLSASVRRYGYNNGKFGFLLNCAIKDDKLPIGPVEHQFKVLKLLGVDLPEKPRLEMWPSRSDDAYIEEMLSSQWLSAKQKLVGINLSSSKRWESKRWPEEYIVRLCDDLNNKDIRVVFTGTEEDFLPAEQLVNSAKVPVINACGKTTINQLACLIKKCSVYISADSSPLHVAAAAGVPFVALFGPTDHKRHLPVADKFEVLRSGLECSPCYKPKCKKRKCMLSITPQEVLSAVEKLL